MDWNWSLILNAAVSLVCALILTVCVPLLKARLGEERFQTLQNRVAICVAAAEQLFGSGEGQKKKAGDVHLRPKCDYIPLSHS